MASLLGILLFCTTLQIEIAVLSRVIVADATFHVAPNGFYQLFTLHGLVSKAIVKNNKTKF